MFVNLVLVQAERAKTLVMKSDLNINDLDQAMKKLEKEYFNKHSFVNELFTKLELIHYMHPKDAIRMTEFYQEVESITEQLKQVITDDASLCRQFESTNTPSLIKQPKKSGVA